MVPDQKTSFFRWLSVCCFSECIWRNSLSTAKSIYLRTWVKYFCVNVLAWLWVFVSGVCTPGACVTCLIDSGQNTPCFWGGEDAKVLWFKGSYTSLTYRVVITHLCAHSPGCGANRWWWTPSFSEDVGKCRQWRAASWLRNCRCRSEDRDRTDGICKISWRSAVKDLITVIINWVNFSSSNLWCNVWKKYCVSHHPGWKRKTKSLPYFVNKDAVAKKSLQTLRSNFSKWLCSLP